MSKANVPTTTLTIIPVRTRSRVVEGSEWEVRCVDGIVEVQPIGEERRTRDSDDGVLDSRDLCIDASSRNDEARVSTGFVRGCQNSHCLVTAVQYSISVLLCSVTKSYFYMPFPFFLW
jgi:hypothetical protein